MNQPLIDVRNNIIGINETIDTPFGKKRLVYADWTASGRMYRPIEDYMLNEVYPYIGNTHTDTTYTGSFMTDLYHKSQEKIKQHVGATENEAILTCGSGMTYVINKFQRILGYKLHEKYKNQIHIKEEDRPIVFITHMEHHSNHTSWLETICDVEIIPPTSEGQVDLSAFKNMLSQYKNRQTKIASVTACSNVTGVYTPYHEIAEIIHTHGGYCFVDFACSGPYVDINMNPENEMQSLDAIFLSPHKFLGGPGTSGILVFRKHLYNNLIPDNPGGGTVMWTSPYEPHVYRDSIEEREDGGTPGFLQTIRTAKAIELKEQMGTENIQKQEKLLLNRLWERVEQLNGVTILANKIKDRHSILSLEFHNLYHNLVVRALNDIFGIQTRGGCSCAGTYAHHLYEVSSDKSIELKNEILKGNELVRLGWVRISLHPTMLAEEIDYIADAIQYIVEHKQEILALYKTDANNYQLDTTLLEQPEYKVLNESAALPSWV